MSEYLPLDAVRSFVSSLRVLRGLVIDRVGGAGCVRDIVYMAQKGEIPREAVLADGVSYTVHGIGCLIRGPEGREVDVDIDDGGHEVFNSWRISIYLESLGGDDKFSRRDLVLACRRLVEMGELESSGAEFFGISKI
ncbi:DUF6896 domain-containing protein [Nocardiopsis sp. CA-288880]|uniref:DUF6896 domain-containing protein n=1 Tax=Nocardiopsis sp. CA-288880 TaxID=3239995 RepID=UPI003D98C9A8